MQLQLDFIEKISIDANINIFNTEHFGPALHALATILKSQFIQLLTVHEDKDNYEYLSKHFSYASTDKSIQRSDNIIKFKDLPQSYIKFAQENIEQKVAISDFLNGVIPLSEKLKDTFYEQSFNAIPFDSNGKLVGVVIYKAETLVQLSQYYPAVYQCLKSVFVNHDNAIKTAQKLNTYQTVLDLMPQRVFWKNRESVYLGCNKAFSDDASLSSPEDIQGVTDYDIFPQEAELYRSDDAKTMTSREHLISSEEPQTHKNGNTIWLRTSKRPITSSQNRVIGVVGTYDDITQLKTVQQELHLAKTKLEDRVTERTQELTDSNTQLENLIDQLQTTQIQLIEKEKMAALGGLVAGIAHEINTPIGIAVTGASQMEHMTNKLKDAMHKGSITKSKFFEGFEQINQGSDLILRNLARASELIRNFKMVAVDQSNDEKRSLKLKSYLHDVVTTMQPKSKKSNVSIYLKGEEDLTVSTYPGTVSQIATNLIDNAIVHGLSSQNGGEIKISFSVTEGSLNLEFRDDGIGIEPSSLAKIFEPFHTSKRGDGGSGLGLSIVYNLVTQKLSGHISCESKTGVGTAFIITIPLK